MAEYSAGWITVPGKGKRWRTAEGKYLMQRPAGGMSGVFDAIRDGLGAADRALGGWLPLPPGLDAQQPPLGDALGMAALQIPRIVKPLIRDTLKKEISGTSRENAQAEQEKVRRTYNRQFSNGMTASPASIMESTSGPGGIWQGLGLSGLGRQRTAQFADDAHKVGLIEAQFGQDMFDPGGVVAGVSSKPSGKDLIHIGAQSPGWILAHEFGHLMDMRQKNPDNPFVKNQLSRLKEDVATMQGVAPADVARRSRMRASTGPALGVGTSTNRDRSLLDAAVEGALEGWATNIGQFRNEIMADKYGKPLAKAAGVNWNNKANAAAKGSYVLGTATPGAITGVVGELLNRGVETGVDLLFEGVVDPLARAARGGRDSGLEQSLRQYGYDPEVYRLRSGGNSVEVLRRRGK